MLVSLAGAMRALNSKGIVHRDLKPQNILLCHSGSKSVSSAADITLKIGKYSIVSTETNCLDKYMNVFGALIISM